jgi:hypothetical protein
LKILFQIPFSHGSWNGGWAPWRSIEARADCSSMRNESFIIEPMNLSLNIKEELGKIRKHNCAETNWS